MVQSEPVEEVCMVGWSRGCMGTGVMLEKWVGAVRQQGDLAFPIDNNFEAKE